MKNILTNLNGWQRLFFVIILLIQLPITIFAITVHKEYIDAKFIAAKLKTLNDKESSPKKTYLIESPTVNRKLTNDEEKMDKEMRDKFLCNNILLIFKLVTMKKLTKLTNSCRIIK